MFVNKNNVNCHNYKKERFRAKVVQAAFVNWAVNYYINEEFFSNNDILMDLWQTWNFPAYINLQLCNCLDLLNTHFFAYDFTNEEIEMIFFEDIVLILTLKKIKLLNQRRIFNYLVFSIIVT